MAQRRRAPPRRARPSSSSSSSYTWALAAAAAATVAVSSPSLVWCMDQAIPPPEPEIMSGPPSVAPPSDDEISSETVHLPELPPDMIPEHFVDGFDALKFPSDPFFGESADSDDMGHAGEPPDKKPHPPGRWLHTADAINDEIFVYGGVSNSETLLNDVWIMNPAEGYWWKLEAATRVAPGDLNNAAGVNKNMADKAKLMDAARPESMPPSPPMQLPPGVKEKVPLGESFEDREKDKMERIPKTIRLTPVPMEAPTYPFAKSMVAVRPEEKKNRRRRRLQGLGAEQQLRGLLKAPPKKGKPGAGGGGKAATMMTPAVYSAMQIHAPELVGDLWVYNLGTRQWYQPPEPVNVGSAALASAKEEGGGAKAAKSGPQPRPVAPSLQPPSRYMHSSIVMQCGKKKLLVVFGGIGSDMILRNDLWQYDPKVNKWMSVQMDSKKKIKKPKSTTPPNPSPPSGREGHSMTAWKEPAKGFPSALIFGGISFEYTPFDDLYQLTLDKMCKTSSWKKLSNEAKPDPDHGKPPGRWMHAAVAAEVSAKTGSIRKKLARRRRLNGMAPKKGKGEKEWRMYIHGGCSKDYTPLDDLWYYQQDKKGMGAWTKVITGVQGGSYPPPARWLHSANLILMEDFEIPAPPPNAKRRRRLSGLTSVSGFLGGAPVAAKGKGETAEPAPSTQVGIMILGGASTNAAMEDQWVFNTRDETWTEWHPSTDHPMAREGHTCTSIGGAQFIDVTDQRRRRRRRRLQMASDEADLTEAMEGPETGSIPSYDPRAEHIRPTEASHSWMFVFGGSGEQGNVEAQMGP